jgi:hypothetical protein
MTRPPRSAALALALVTALGCVPSTTAQGTNMLNAHNVNVHEVKTMGSTGSIYGYFPELDEDGYSLLKRASGKD